jgi:hypothetical protein
MDIQHRFDRGFRPAKQATVFIKDGRLYQKDAPEGAEEVRAAKLLDTGFYDELFLIETDDDYWVYVVSVSAQTEENGPFERKYCVFGKGLGDAIACAYYLAWTEGGRKSFTVTAIGEAEPVSEDCLEYRVKRLDTPKLPVYRMLEKLTDRNALFVSELIDMVYRMTEEELLAYEREVLPEGERYIGSPAPATEDELIKRMWDGIYYDRTAWETNTQEGSILRHWLLSLVDKAQTNEEKKLWLNMFILLPYGTYFLTTAYETVLNETLPDIGDYPS